MLSYQTQGVCSSQIFFEVQDGRVYNVRFVDGCKGNLAGISSLVQGMEIEEVINRLKGIECSGTSSCPNELAKALEKFIKENNKKAL